MDSIKIEDYIKKAIKLDYPADFKWLTDMFAYLVDSNYEDKYVKIDKNNFYVKLPDNEDSEKIDVYLLTDKYKEPILTPQMKITVEKGFLPNIREDIETTVGRLIVNYLLLARVFGDKIDYINKPFTVSYIENEYIVKYLVSKGEEDKKPKSISIDEYTKFIDTVSYIIKLNKLLVHAGGPLVISRPPDIVQYRKKLIEEAKKKYGEDALERLDVVGEIDKKLEEYEKEYIKDDPVLVPKISGKTLGAMKKMYAAYGHGGDFFYKDGKAHYLEKSLEEGWDDTKEAITILYNDIRMGSYSRGFKTQKGGYTAKQGLRATTDLKIVKGDCGSKTGLPIIITEKNYKEYLGRYIIVNNKPLLLTEDNIKNYFNKNVLMRSPMFCHMDTNFCSTCMGKNVENYENGISIMVINMAGVILNASMKAMHDQSIKLAKLDIDDLI